jgi:hypothetical protein
MVLPAPGQRTPQRVAPARYRPRASCQPPYPQADALGSAIAATGGRAAISAMHGRSATWAGELDVGPEVLAAKAVATRATVNSSSPLICQDVIACPFLPGVPSSWRRGRFTLCARLAGSEHD